MKEEIIKIVREIVGMPEHFDDKKYLESIDHLYSEPIAKEILKLSVLQKKEILGEIEKMEKEGETEEISNDLWYKDGYNQALEDIKKLIQN